MTLLDNARRALTDLALRAEWLEDSLLNGTPRPYRPSHMTAEAREAADAQARLERRERTDLALASTADPMWTDGLELLTDILDFADAAADNIAQAAGVERMPDASFGSDPIPYLEHASRWLLQADDAEPGRKYPVSVLRKAEMYVQRADELLGHITDGQTLDLPCFVCDSRDDQHPIGGGRTLRYRRQHRGHRPAEVCGLDCRDLIVCEGDRCAPTDAQCGYTFRGHPAWDLRTEAPWLVDQINAAKAARTCRCGQTLPAVTGPGRPPVYCSDECRRAADAERKAEDRKRAA